jgi:hypothetical protein
MNKQPYDGSIKEIFKEDAAQLLPHFLSGATLVSVKDIEILRSPMRSDRVYCIEQNDTFHILDVEFQAGYDNEMEYRILIYHASLLKDYKLPVISIVIYLFRTTVAHSPLVSRRGDGKEVLMFHFEVLKMWEFDAREYIKERAIDMYIFLPLMDHANAHVLLQAVDEMVEYYQADEAKLARRLLWFGLFLERTDTVVLEDKKKVEESLNTFDQLLEDYGWVRRKRAIWKQQAQEEGFASGFVPGQETGFVQGELQIARQILINIAARRYPVLASLAKQQAEKTTDLDKLSGSIEQIAIAPDEATARFVLNTLLSE